MTKPITPTIERLKFKDLFIDPIYSGRSTKEINENAKDKQKELAAAGGWNPAMPGHYFEAENGTKCLLAGFSRVQASIANGETEGYFVRVEGDVIDHLLACETTNSVKPLSPLSRGNRYYELKEGKPLPDIEKPDPKNKDHWERMPMSAERIAERIGKTPVWVSKCVAIFLAPPEVRDLLESEKIAVTVAEGARALANKYWKGSDPKVIAICKRAFAYARAEEADTATKKHFDAIKAEFIPLKADRKDEDKEKTPDKGNGADNKPSKGSEGKSNADTADDEKKGNGATTEQLPADDEAESLFQQQTKEVMEEGSKKNKKLKEAWSTILMNPDNLEEMTLEPETIEALIEKLHAAMIAARDVF